jgi:hypothetical protein
MWGSDPVNGVDPTGMHICNPSPCPAEIGTAITDMGLVLVDAALNGSYEEAAYLSASLTALGAEGDPGVVFNIGPIAGGLYGTGAVGSDGYTIEISIDPTLFASPRANVAGVVGHEVDHGMTGRAFGNPVTNPIITVQKQVHGQPNFLS